MNPKKQPRQKGLIRTGKDKLARLRGEILVLEPEKALERILDHPFPVTLVQSFKPQDLYVLVHKIGPEDALPLLSLASNQQWEYIIDMEAWQRDRVDNHSLTVWFHRLLRADADRFTHWVFGQQIDTFRLYLFKNLELKIREHDQDPTEMGNDFFSDDETFYLRFKPYATFDPADKQLQDLRDQFLTDLLRRISVLDHIKYQGLLLEADALVPAEAEEELYRLRNIRLAEQGLLPHEEAVGIYQYLDLEHFFRRPPKTIRSDAVATTSELVPVINRRQAGDDNLFVKTLARIQDQATVQWLQSEFAGLCNQLISADQVRIRDQAVLAQVVAKARDYLGIGLEKIRSKGPEGRRRRLTGILETFFLTDLFRLGFGCALKIKWDAEKWLRSSWFRKNGLPLSFWDEYWMGVIGGLLVKKPLFFDNFTSGVIYREFSCLDEIAATGQVIEAVTAFDDLLALLEARPPREPYLGHLSYKSLLLTLWADHRLGLATGRHRPIPLNRKQLQAILRNLWTESGPSRKIGDGIKSEFLNWLADRAALAPEAVSRRLGHLLEELFSELETELGAVDERHIDPRFVNLFLTAK